MTRARAGAGGTRRERRAAGAIIRRMRRMERDAAWNAFFNGDFARQVNEAAEVMSVFAVAFAEGLARGAEQVRRWQEDNAALIEAWLQASLVVMPTDEEVAQAGGTWTTDAEAPLLSAGD